MAINPNPQGKGLVPVLAAWEASRPTNIAPKNAGRIISDYFTSLLVLSAEFSFKPLAGQHYYLYWRASSRQQSPLLLSLIEPERNGAERLGLAMGQCQLQPDMTWSIRPSANMTDNPEIRRFLQHFQQQFIDNHDNDQSMEDNLPVFVTSLPFYRRMAALALSTSLKYSINSGKLQGASARHWLDDCRAGQRQLLDMNA